MNSTIFCREQTSIGYIHYTYSGKVNSSQNVLFYDFLCYFTFSFILYCYSVIYIQSIVYHIYVFGETFSNSFLSLHLMYICIPHKTLLNILILPFFFLLFILLIPYPQFAFFSVVMVKFCSWKQHTYSSYIPVMQWVLYFLPYFFCWFFFFFHSEPFNFSYNDNNSKKMHSQFCMLIDW